MTKKQHSKTYLEKYFAVLNKFGVSPNFKFDDNEKEIIKYLDEVTSVPFLMFCDKYDLRPSEAKEIIDALIKKGALKMEEDKISLTNEVIKYLHTSKEQRKSEKKFRKFIDALNEKDLDEFMKLVETFVIQPPAVKKPRAPRKPRTTTTRKTTTRTRKAPVKKETPALAEEKKAEAVPEVKKAPARRKPVAKKVVEEPKEVVPEEVKPVKRTPRKRVNKVVETKKED